MELMQQVKGYSDSREDEEDEEAASATATAEMIRIPREESSSRLHQQDAASNNLMNQQRNHQLELMELSVGRNKNDEGNYQQQQQQQGNESVEKEHMFDKVVTPSDVGKLNRLVIPKQHAEKYFPLDSSSNEKGLLLNFEDRNGKLWRFRYSYWNSSQSYVMTKGWSRFVKEKKLDSGDIVSFQRGLGDLYRHRLYIDWRRRPDHVNHVNHAHDPSSTFISPLFLPNQYSISWGGRFYSPPASTPCTMPPPPRHHDHFHQQQHFNYSHMYTFQQQIRPQHHHQQYYGDGGGSGSEAVYYLRSTPTPSMSMQQLGDQQQERGDNMIIDSVPVSHRNNAGKRLRLFGVNMECASSPEEDSSSASAPHVAMANSFPSSSLPVPHEDDSSTRFRDQRGGTSVPFDLDPSLQYRH